MKIAYVVHDVSKQRGHDRYTAELIEHLSARHTIHVFSSSLNNIGRKGFIFHKIPVVKFFAVLKNLSFIILSFPAVLLAHKRIKFDIIHYQGACAFPLDPAVITAHACSAELLKVYMKFAKSETLFKRTYHYIHTYLTAFLEKVFFSQSSVLKIIAPSEIAKEYLIKHYSLPPDNIERIYEGVNIDEFKRAKNPSALREKFNISSSDFVILFIGDYVIKGLHVAVKAIKNLRCKLLILGRGDKPYYKQLACEENVADNIIFLEWQANAAEYFQVADAFLSPALCDSFGLSTIEALASGVPCLVSALAGVSELLKDGESVVLLEYPFDCALINRKLKELIGNDSLRENIIKKGKDIASKYTWEKVARETEALYENLHTGKR